MTNIKVKVKGAIKRLYKEAVGVQKIKNNLVTAKEKIGETTSKDSNNSAEEYASQKVQNQISVGTRKILEKANEIGKKSVKETAKNFVKTKIKTENFKSKIKQKKANDLKQSVDNTIKVIKNGTKRTIKNVKFTANFTGKGIKNSERISKETLKVTTENLKKTQKALQVSKYATSKMAECTKRVTKKVISTIKTIIKGAKAPKNLFIAGGFVSIVIIIMIVIIAGFIVAIFNGDGNSNYDSSQIPNSEIVLVAEAQIGNEGGGKFWKWYGFNERVEWCACFVSWCANECGYVDKEIIPKFSACINGIEWFKERRRWADREGYIPKIGDIIFFDWKNKSDENQDGVSDHVGIVKSVDIENKKVHTIEGNSGDAVKKRTYDINDVEIMGYGFY